MPSLTASGGHFVEGRNRHRCNSLSIPGGEARSRLCRPGLPVLWRGLRFKEQDQPCRGCTRPRHRRVNSLLILATPLSFLSYCKAAARIASPLAGASSGKSALYIPARLPHHARRSRSRLAHSARAITTSGGGVIDLASYPLILTPHPLAASCNLRATCSSKRSCSASMVSSS